MKFFCSFSLAIAILLAASVARADSITWKGYTWTVKAEADAGPGPNDWSGSNVFVDTNGYLHLKITHNADTGKWECAELYTSDDLGFGTYQWQIESRIDRLDPSVILGLFNYNGPDGNNEIDIDYSRGDGVGGGWNVCPSSGTTTGHKSFTLSLGGTNTTSRLTWSKSGVHFSLMKGLTPVGVTTNVISAWNYDPTNPTQNIPQDDMPLHMNLWLDGGHAPASGKPAEVIIRDFTFTPDP